MLQHVFPLPPNLWPDCTSSLLIGPAGSHKTSMMFQFLHSQLLTHQDQMALYVCSQEMSQLPVHVMDMPLPTIDSSDRLQILYLSTLDDLFEHLAELYTSRSSLNAVAIDDLSVFMTRRRINSLVSGNYNQVLGRLFSLLIDTVEHMRIKVMMASGFDSVRECRTSLIAIGSLYFDQVLMIEPISSFSSDRSSFQITDHLEQFRLFLYFQDKQLKLKHVQKKQITS